MPIAHKFMHFRSLTCNKEGLRSVLPMDTPMKNPVDLVRPSSPESPRHGSHTLPLRHKGTIHSKDDVGELKNVQ